MSYLEDKAHTHTPTAGMATWILPHNKIRKGYYFRMCLHLILTNKKRGANEQCRFYPPLYPFRSYSFAFRHIYWLLSLFVIPIGFFRISSYLLASFVFHHIYWLLSYFIISIGFFRFSSYLLASFVFHHIYWLLSYFIISIGFFRFSSYILAFFAFRHTYWLLSYFIISIGFFRISSYDGQIRVIIANAVSTEHFQSFKEQIYRYSSVYHSFTASSSFNTKTD